MSNERRDMLQEWERRAREQQEQWMNHIASRLGRERVTTEPLHPNRGAPAFWHEYDLDEQERTQLFMTHWQEVGGYAHHVPDMEAAQQWCVAQLREMDAGSIIVQAQPPLTDLHLADALPGVQMTVWNSGAVDKMQRQAALADAGVAMADYAVASTGSVVLFSGANQGRTVSLLPGTLIVIIPVAKVKTRLGEVMAEIEALQPGEMPAGIHFISGPSRSADIENDLTIGVHGPGVVHALIVG